MGYIYWIASYPKSGNTWMRAFLASLVVGKDTPNLDDLKAFAPNDNHGGAYQPFLAKPIHQATLEELAAARPRAQEAFAKATDGFSFLKTHSMLGQHFGTPTINPRVTAGAIYIIRNPLDVVVSYSAFRNRTVDATIELMMERDRVLAKPAAAGYQIAGAWDQHIESWTRNRYKWVHVVRYEDMLDTPHATFTGIVHFLRMDADAGAIDRAIAGTKFDALKRAEEELGFDERPGETMVFFRKGKKGEWQEHLTPAQVARVVNAFEPLMRHYGYWEAAFDSYLQRPQAETEVQLQASPVENIR